MSELAGIKERGYELVEPIRSGGFGAVYRARQSSVDREVAIKVILPEHSDQPQFQQRFETEARTVAKLEHPHIVPLYDYWQDEQGAFLVMRYLKGGSLRDRLDWSGAMNPQEAGRILEQVCGALSAAHQVGVVHRDIKPENILLDEEGRAYLTDFGIAKDLIGGEKLTRTGAMVGSAAYVSPEQAKGEPVSPQTDIYALGILLFELLTGEHPFPDLDPIQVIQRHITQKLPSMDLKGPHIPEGMNGFIQKATAKIPAHRYESAGEFNEALQRLLGRSAESASLDRRTPLPRFLEDTDQGKPAPTFVGREEELDRLHRRLAAAFEGRGGILFLVGNAGQGKTALLQAFTRAALEVHSDLLVAFGTCNAQSGIGDPYLPFREALDMLAGGVEGSWSTGTIPTEGAKRLWREMSQTVKSLIEVGPDLVDMMIPANSLLTRAEAVKGVEWASELERFLDRKAVFQASSPVKQLDLFEQYTRVLRRLAETNPLLLILDDFQWADDASISLLFHLTRRLTDRPILLLCAYRPDEVALGREGDRHPLEQVVNEVKREQGEVVLDLSREESIVGMDFIHAFLDSEPNKLGEEFRQALFDHTGGHPLFTVELLRAMQERGDLVTDQEGSWIEGENLAWNQLPARVEAVIEERIARLEEEIRDLLTVASVEGHDFTAQVLARVQEVEERKLLRELSQELGKRHRLVRELGEVTTGRQILSKYQFAHHLFQRYLYNGLSAAERRLLHGEITAVLEDLFQEEVDRAAVQLAYHSQRANLTEKASRYLKIAGEQAKRSYANQEASRYFTELLGMLPENDRKRFSVLALRASVYDLMAKREEQLADAEEMLAIARTLGDESLEVDALLALTDAHIESEHVLAEEPAEKALALAKKLGDPLQEASALRRLGWSAWLKGNYGESRVYLEEAVEQFRRAEELGQAANCLHILALALGATYDYQGALQAAEEAVELSRKVGDRRQEAISLRRLSIVHSYNMEFEESLALGEQALALHREVGDWSEEAHALNVIGIDLGWLGLWEESERRLLQSLEIGRELGSTTAIQFATWNLCTTVFWRRGEYVGALDLVDQEFNHAMAAEDDWLIGALHFQRGMFLRELGQFDSALSAFQAADSVIERLAPKGVLHVNNLAWIGLIQAELGERSKAVEQIERSMELANRMTNPADRSASAHINAHTALNLGDKGILEKAKKQLYQGLEQVINSREFDTIEESLNMAARIQLLEGDIEMAYEHTLELARLLDFVPAHPAPQDYAYTHSQVLEALGRSDESREYLRRAYDWIMLVAGRTEDEGLRNSWLEDARRNDEILAMAGERGIAG